MKGRRYFIVKLAVVVIYLCIAAALVIWIIAGWPREVTNDIGAEVTALPGALEGRTLILVTNSSPKTWNRVELTVDDSYVHTTGSIEAGAQYSVPLDDFIYTYAIPRRWDRGFWDGLSEKKQPSEDDVLTGVPAKIRIKTDVGEVEESLAEGQRSQ
ncbi:MAG: hypothetical protein AUK47_23935 [Deltaproteobacteria bacterium CG2_30_63_29]|nr:MAG: hypothetical protein AUK47_23935 [Deltaproteobacteria bacterium CG2_30_63_29]PIW02533.1 MAG: hypothetical protein COW42_01140 [Deltaproteobacteria bacterium CG17_big_fil_post_rev_8_21_14_2_50_63_7]PJB35898.1 MAG: hypothetical protein CO108_24520 [Deltaproteobacteria bacterium CG_4_9_14_3_um_filter_63_12]